MNRAESIAFVNLMKRVEIAEAKVRAVEALAAEWDAVTIADEWDAAERWAAASDVLREALQDPPLAGVDFCSRDA